MLMLRDARSLLFFLALVSVSANGPTTYQRVDQRSGEVLVCARCPPGFHLRAHCTRSRQTECGACGAGLFTERWNYIAQCLRCGSCGPNQWLVRPCNRSADAVCECARGSYWDQYFCRTHRACPPGHGVKAAGTPHTDTVCEGCGDGQFAEAASPCVNHSACASDQHLLVAGSRRHDAVCARCEQMTAAGWGKLFRPFLSDLLARRLPTRRTRTLLAEKLRLLERQGPDDEMLMLPQLLKQSRLHHLADKVSSKIRHFQKLVSRCLAPP